MLPALFWTSNDLMWSSHYVSRAVCLPSGYDAWWCHQIAEKQLSKSWTFLPQECKERWLSAFLPPLWGYQAAVGTDQSLYNITEKHPSICQRSVSFKRLAGSKDVGVRCDVHDKRRSQTIEGSVGMKALSRKCGWVTADESESSWPRSHIEQLINVVSFVWIFCVTFRCQSGKHQMEAFSKSF